MPIRLERRQRCETSRPCPSLRRMQDDRQLDSHAHVKSPVTSMPNGQVGDEDAAGIDDSRRDTFVRSAINRKEKAACFGFQSRSIAYLARRPGGASYFSPSGSNIPLRIKFNNVALLHTFIICATPSSTQHLPKSRRCYFFSGTLAAFVSFGNSPSFGSGTPMARLHRTSVPVDRRRHALPQTLSYRYRVGLRW